MKVNTGPYKGARDFYPEDKRLQQWMFSKWKKVVERFGYEEYDASVIEPIDIYLMKTSEEIVNEQVYSFTDRGDRKVVLRPEMTPTVSRMIAGRRQELAFPVRWYSIPNLWRYERPQKGRLREHWQLNVDLFGVSSTFAELEMLHIVDSLFQEFGARRSSYAIKVNSRVLINTMFEFVCELNEEQTTKLIRLTDKMNKMPKTEFRKEVDKISKSMKKTDKIISLLQSKYIKDLPLELQKSPSVLELNNLLETCKSQGLRNVEFDITLMRGFDYYTDIVFEAFDTNPENNRSLFGGGRYDGLVSQFGVDAVPTIGFGMGDVTFRDFLETHKLIPVVNSSVEVILLLRDEVEAGSVHNVTSELRDLGVNVAVDYSGKKFDKQYKSAIKSGVKYAVYVGKEELTNNNYVLKDLTSGKEEKHSVKRISKIIKDSINR